MYDRVVTASTAIVYIVDLLVIIQGCAAIWSVMSPDSLSFSQCITPRNTTEFTVLDAIMS
jgi:hypothetical protein